MKYEPLYPRLTLLLHQFSSGFKDDFISYHSRWAVVNTTVAGEAIEEGLS
jgi:hypothetical protein